MVSIAENMKGLNGDGWGTTMSKNEQIKHLNYVKNIGNSYEDDREKELAAMKMSLDPKSEKSEKSREEKLTNFKTSFVDDFFHGKGFNDSSFENTYSEDIKNLRDEINKMSKHMSEMNTKINELETKLNELSVPKSFFTKITNWFGCISH